MKHLIPFLLTLTLLAACAPTQPALPDTPVDSDTPPNGLPPIYEPRPGDDKLQRVEVFDVTAEILAAESFPVQYFLILKGNLPTPCNELRVIVYELDPKNKINLIVYSVTDPNRMCAEMIQPFEQNIPLGSFPAGHYTVWVNEEKVAEFDG